MTDRKLVDDVLWCALWKQTDGTWWPVIKTISYSRKRTIFLANVVFYERAATMRRRGNLRFVRVEIREIVKEKKK